MCELSLMIQQQFHALMSDSNTKAGFVSVSTAPSAELLNITHHTALKYTYCNLIVVESINDCLPFQASIDRNVSCGGVDDEE